MGLNKGAVVCPLDDNTVFVIRKHGEDGYDRIFTNSVRNTLSRQTSINSYQSKTSRLTLDEDLEALKSANIIFIRHIQRNTAKLASVNKYTIVNTCGETLFYAVELVEEESQSKSKTKREGEIEKCFKFVVVNSQGEEVYDVDGQPATKDAGAYATVRRDSTILGAIAQSHQNSSKFCLSLSSKRIPAYLIESPDGRTLQKIQPASSFRALFQTPVDFNVCSPDGSITKAKIARQPNAISLEEFGQTDTYALSFHTTDMDGKLKALLITAVIMLDFQLAEKAEECLRSKNVCYRLLFCIFLLCILLAFILLLVHNAAEFQREKVKRFPGAVPPP